MGGSNEKGMPAEEVGNSHYTPSCWSREQPCEPLPPRVLKTPIPDEVYVYNTRQLLPTWAIIVQVLSSEAYEAHIVFMRCQTCPTHNYEAAKGLMTCHASDLQP